jgi:hypothetical protein
VQRWYNLDIHMDGEIFTELCRLHMHLDTYKQLFQVLISTNIFIACLLFNSLQTIECQYTTPIHASHHLVY